MESTSKRVQMIDLCSICVSYVVPKYFGDASNGVRYHPYGKVSYNINRLDTEILEAISNGERFTTMDGSHLPMRAVTTVSGSRYCEVHVK